MERIPVEQLELGDSIATPRGKRVRVQRVDFYPEKQVGDHVVPEGYVIRWAAGERLGSFVSYPKGKLVPVIARVR